MSATAIAGWYQDPSGEHALRWWDGAQWTAHVHDHPAGAQPPIRLPDGTKVPRSDQPWIRYLQDMGEFHMQENEARLQKIEEIHPGSVRRGKIGPIHYSTNTIASGLDPRVIREVDAAPTDAQQDERVYELDEALGRLTQHHPLMQWLRYRALRRGTRPWRRKRGSIGSTFLMLLVLGVFAWACYVTWP